MMDKGKASKKRSDTIFGWLTNKRIEVLVLWAKCDPTHIIELSLNKPAPIQTGHGLYNCCRWHPGFFQTNSSVPLPACWCSHMTKIDAVIRQTFLRRTKVFGAKTSEKTLSKGDPIWSFARHHSTKGFITLAPINLGQVRSVKNVKTTNKTIHFCYFYFIFQEFAKNILVYTLFVSFGRLPVGGASISKVTGPSLVKLTWNRNNG
jgi:hypothetical protein